MSGGDPIWVRELRHRMRGRGLGGALRWVRRAASTNDLARRWLDDGGPEGLVVVADLQTSGRGRRGRSWSSPEGLGLYLSVGLRPALAGSRAGWLTLLGAVAAAEALRTHGVGAVIRWPNDIDAARGKIGGVLCEGRIEGTRLTSAVLGIGLNLGHAAADFPPELAGRATSARMECGTAPSRAEVAAALLQRLEDGYAELSAGPDAAPLLQQVRELSPGSDGSVVIVDGEGESFHGTTRGIEPDGALRIERPDGTVVAIRVGEIRRLRRPADGCPPTQGEVPCSW